MKVNYKVMRMTYAIPNEYDRNLDSVMNISLIKRYLSRATKGLFIGMHYTCPSPFICNLSKTSGSLDTFSYPSWQQSKTREGSMGRHDELWSEFYKGYGMSPSPDFDNEIVDSIAPVPSIVHVTKIVDEITVFDSEYIASHLPVYLVDQADIRDSKQTQDCIYNMIYGIMAEIIMINSLSIVDKSVDIFTLHKDKILFTEDRLLLCAEKDMGLNRLVDTAEIDPDEKKEEYFNTISIFLQKSLDKTSYACQTLRHLKHMTIILPMCFKDLLIFLPSKEHPHPTVWKLAVFKKYYDDTTYDPRVIPYFNHLILNP